MSRLNWEQKQQAIALKIARDYARNGSMPWAQLFVNRANSFWLVTDRQVANVQKCYDER